MMPAAAVVATVSWRLWTMSDLIDYYYYYYYT